MDTNNQVPVWIGNNAGPNRAGDSGDNRPWEGNIDELMIFQAALSDSEIMALYNRNLNNYKAT